MKKSILLVLLTILFQFYGCKKQYNKELNSENISSKIDTRLTTEIDSGIPDIVITDVNVISMINNQILVNQTIVMDKGVILSISPTKNHHINAKKIINANGMYIIPGLHDMHTHVVTTAFAKALGIDDQFSNLPYEDLFSTYLANGITTIQVLSGGEDLIGVRDAIKNKTILGPDIILSSPMLDGNPPIIPEPFTKSILNASQVESILNEIKQQGYDFIKLRVNLSKPIFDEIVKTSKKLNLPVMGHVPRSEGLSLEYVVKTKNFGIAHMEEFGYDNSSPNNDDIDRYTALLKDNDSYIITTLNVFDNIIDKMVDYDSTLNKANTKYVHPLFKTLWQNNPFKQEISPERLEYIKTQLNIQKKLVFAFYKSGIPIMLGTDALNPTIIPGFSIHREFELIMESGLSAFEALRMATVIPAQNLDPSNTMAGTISIGQSTDLLILKSNPLGNMSTLKMPEYVIKDGVIFDKSMLRKKLEQLERLIND